MNHQLIISTVFFVVSISLANCGVVTEKRIINGQDVEENVPYTAMVSGFNSDYATFGGGSFVSYAHVVTAANLIYNMDWWYVDYGKETLGNMPYAAVERAVSHPDYDPVSFENDIGLLFLSFPVDYNLVTPIPLPYVRNTPYINEQGRLSGFGMALTDQDWILQQTKQTGYYRRIEDSKCDFVLGHQIPETRFCAQDLDYDSSICYGDLGSGLTVYIDDINTLVGIVSIFTNQCHRDFPVVFTKVAPYTDWIMQQINEEL